MSVIRILYNLFSKKDRLRFLFLFFMSACVSLVEIFSLSAIMLFISAATNFDAVFQKPYFKYVYSFLGCNSPVQFVMVLGVFLIVFYIFRCVLNVVHLYAMSSFAYTYCYHRFTKLLFSRFLHFPYQSFTSKNSSSVFQAVFTYTGTMTLMVLALLVLIAEMFTVICIYGVLFYVNWKMTVVLSLFLSIKGFLVIKAFSRSITNAGKSVQRFTLESTKLFHESVGNFKLIKLGSFEGATVDRFSDKKKGYSKAQILYQTLQGSPRFAIETIGFLLLVGVVLYALYFYKNIQSIIPIVSLYALAFYRIMPSMNKILSGINQIAFSKHAVQGIDEFLKVPLEVSGVVDVCFNNAIEIRNLSFEYEKNKNILSDVDIKINKGDRVAFVGESGAGKSTIVDLIMGLYHPQRGVIYVDGQRVDDSNKCAWRGKIGYIPQSIYLFDGTVADNVVFGRQYDENKVVQALKKAHVYDFLKTLQGLETLVGEGGIKLSGGQKQRVAIARALYSDPELLVLDEATSALDNQTESCIMDEIYQIDRTMTLIIVAHRLSTVARCDKIYKIDQGKVFSVSFSQVGSKQPDVANIQSLD